MMQQPCRPVTWVTVSVTWILSHSASAGVTYFAGNQPGWAAAAGPFSTCGFTGFPPATPITGQYQASLGITFTGYQGIDFSNEGDSITFPQDGAGLFGGGGTEMLFSQPTLSLAAHGPHRYRIQLFDSNDVMFYESPLVPSGVNSFGGVVSTIAFAKARFWVFDGEDNALDNIYFSTVPGPGGVAVLVCGLTWARRVRRRT